MSHLCSTGRIFTASLVAILIHTASAHAQQNCDAVLQRTDVSRVTTLTQKLSLLKSIDSQQKWEDAKKISGGLTAIIEDIPVAANVDYSTFTNWQSSYLANYSFNLDTAQSDQLVTSFLPPDAIQGWRDCVLGTQGLLLYATDLTARGVTAVIEWKPPPLSENTEVEIVAPSIDPGDSVINQPTWPQKIRGNKTFTMRLRRDPSRESSINFTQGVASWAPHIVIPAEPKPLAKNCALNPSGYVTCSNWGSSNPNGGYNFPETRLAIHEGGAIPIFLTGLSKSRTYTLVIHGQIFLLNDPPAPNRYRVSAEISSSPPGGASISGQRQDTTILRRIRLPIKIGSISPFQLNRHLLAPTEASRQTLESMCAEQAIAILQLTAGSTMSGAWTLLKVQACYPRYIGGPLVAF
jgi:hypothetical protein